MSFLGITSFGVYIPRLRIDRGIISEAHAWMNPVLKSTAKGSRAFCSWDEDSITMAVEAGLDCISNTNRENIESIYIASTTLPYADLQSSVIVASALQLNPDIQSCDITNSHRAATTALIQASQSRRSTLLVATENPVAKPASMDEVRYGAGAVAFALETENVIAELLGSVTAAENFVDTFRASNEVYSQSWEDRWIRDEGALKILSRVIKDVLVKTGLSINDIGYLIVPPIQQGIAKSLARTIGFSGKIADEISDGCGYIRTAHSMLMLANVLEKAKAEEIILLVGFGHGADAVVLKTTHMLENRRPQRGVHGSLSEGLDTDSYLRMLSFYDGIDLHWGMRSENNRRTSLSAQYRSIDQMSAFSAGSCSQCGTVQFPQQQYCVNSECHAPASQFKSLSLVSEPCELISYTSDWLSYYPSPPLRLGFVQYKNGARLIMEIVDVGPEDLEVGLPMRQVFRIKEKDQKYGYRRYFWKAAPI